MKITENLEAPGVMFIEAFDHEVVDLFCGAGGSSTGLLKAAERLGVRVKLYAINHWELAIATHSLNHPGVVHINSDLEKINPSDVVKSGKLRLVIASPECTHFSNARGGKPMNKQSRATVKWVVKWLSVLNVDGLQMENVREFMTWGPLHKDGPLKDRPIEHRKGEYYRAFLRKLKRMGYQVKTRILNAANYGDATTRQRFFLIASKVGEPMWPESTHAENPNDMFLKPWRTAEEIIDWQIKGKSIYTRERPLVGNTMKRIWHGFYKHSGGAFLLGQQSGSVPRSVDQPVMTIAGEGAIAMVEPYLVTLNGTSDRALKGSTRSLNRPVPAITGSLHHGLVQPVLRTQEPRTRSIKKPIGTVTNRNSMGLVQPFIMALDQGGRTRAIDEPMFTMTSADCMTLVEPYLVSLEHTGANGSQTRSAKKPIPTITGNPRIALLEPYMIEYYGTAKSQSIKKPLNTVTGKDRVGLVQPIIKIGRKKYILDFLYRMLEPKELAAAMSFPKEYKFVGNRGEVVKQIGNAVPINLSAALSERML